MSITDDHGFGQLLDDWSRAIVANDPAAIGEFAEPDWVMVGESGIFPRAEFLEAVATGQLTHDSMKHEVHDVRIHGDVAIVIARVVNTGAWEGERFEADEWSTDIYIRRDAGWKCALTHLTTAVTTP